MTYFKIIFLLILAMLERCNIIKKQVEPREVHISQVVEERDTTDIIGSWQWHPILAENTAKNTGQAADRTKKNKNTVSQEEVLLSFFQDSTFTEIARTGQYRKGTFTLSEETLSLHFDENDEKFKVNFDTLSSVHRVLLMTDRNGHQSQFVENAFPLKKFEEDPYYHTNNTWRIKPASPESPVQIQRRLTNYLKHSGTIFKAATARNQSSISWMFSRGIIRIYDRGIGSVGPDDLPDPWVNCFYSKEDAMKAYDLFNSYLRSYKSNGESTGDWVVDNYNILMSVHDIAQSDITDQ